MLLWLAIAACASIPFLTALHTYPIPTFYAEYATGICWVALAVVMLILTYGSRMGVPQIALAPLALIVVLFVKLQVAPPLNPFLSLAATIFLLATVVTCALGARARSFPGVLETLAVGLITGGLLTVAIEFVQLFRIEHLPTMLFSINPTGTLRRMWGNLNQPNHAASYLAFGLAACAFLVSKCPRARAGVAVVALILLVGMSLTFSRITWLHIILVGGLTGLAWTVDQRGWRRWLMACVPVVLLVVAYQLCNWLVAYANTLWHLGLSPSMGDRMQEGTGLRTLLWKHAWHMFLAHPWLGGGWGDYAWNQYVQTDVLGNVEMSMNAHNIVLDLLSKVGLLGLAAVALPAVGFVWGLRKRRMTPALAFLLAIVLVLGAHSMLEYPLHYLYFLLLFAFVLGFADERNFRMPSGSMTWTLMGVLSAFAAALMVQLWGDYRAVERLHYAPEGLPKELARYRERDANLLLPYETQAIAINWNVTQAMAGSLAKLELHAVQFYPGSTTVQRYALALAYLGKIDDAVLQVRRLHSQYWSEYAAQSWLLTQECGLDRAVLKAFCSRLQDEKLLVKEDKLPSKTSSPRSQ